MMVKLFILLSILIAVEPKVTITISIPASIWLSMNYTPSTMQVLTDKVNVMFPVTP